MATKAFIPRATARSHTQERSLELTNPARGTLASLHCSQIPSDLCTMQALAFPTEEPASEPTEAGVILLRSRPYLVRPVGGAGGGGGGAFSPKQQAESPSVAAAKATKVKYFTIFISAV